MAIPFSVIGGFLGAGKTTFINTLLASPEGVKYGVLVNDFGALTIDASLLAGVGREVFALANGCACCSVGNDLVAAIQKLQAMQIDHIVLECSGVAIPAKLADLAKLAPDLIPHAIITLVNGQNIGALLTDKWMADTTIKQLESGGQLLLNRFADEEQLAGIQLLLSEYGCQQSVADQALYMPAQWLAKPVRGGNAVEHSVQQLGSRTVQARSLQQAQKWAQKVSKNTEIYRMKGFVVDQQKSWLVQVVDTEVTIEQFDNSLSESQVGLVLIGNQQAVDSFYV